MQDSKGGPCEWGRRSRISSMPSRSPRRNACPGAGPAASSTSKSGSWEDAPSRWARETGLSARETKDLSPERSGPPREPAGLSREPNPAHGEPDGLSREPNPAHGEPGGLSREPNSLSREPNPAHGEPDSLSRERGRSAGEPNGPSLELEKVATAYRANPAIGSKCPRPSDHRLPKCGPAPGKNSL
jgi:hypothetical protein